MAKLPPLSSRSALLFLLPVHLLYLLFDQWGLFHVVPPVLRETLYSGPSLALAALEALAASIGIIERMRRGGAPVMGAGLFLLSIVVISAGLWTSYLTRFEGNTIKAEGQSFTAFEDEYVPGSVYKSRLSRPPELGLTLLKLRGRHGDDIPSAADLTADILYSGRWSKRVGERRLGRGVPLYHDWTLATIIDMGYAPRYQLTDTGGRPLESHAVYLKLHPPGKEGSFEVLFLGYIFYLQCYPDFNGSAEAPRSASALLRNPVYHLRIVRHKDIVYDGPIAPHERLRFDNYVISFPEVKMWAEIRFVRDLGIPLIALGILIMVSGLVVMLLRKERL